MEEIDSRDILLELARRAKANERPNILDHPSNFQQQRDFILHPSKLKALFCTRRSAKSFTAGLYLVHEALNNPGCNCLFIGLTRDSAKAIIWKDVLRVINYTHKLGAIPNQTDLTMTFPNGSVIKVTGVDAEEDEMNKLLGRKHRLVCIDEASMYTIDTRNLVYGILKPGVADPNEAGERGTICMMGTASDFPRGLFFDVTRGTEAGWQLFEWSAHDNPHVAKQWQEELNDIATNRPLYMETPQFKQWYLNHWVIDENKLVYRFNPQRNLISLKDFTELSHRLDPNGWSVVVGGDTGWEDDNALIKTAYHQNDPHLYVMNSWAQKKLTFDQYADKITKEFMPGPWGAHRVVIDGANKQGVESMRQRSNIPFEYADKQDKVTFIELCNSDLVQGKIKFVDIPENRPTWEEMASLVWVTEGEKIKLPKKEHPALPNHRCDAFLYAWRNGYHYQSQPKEVKHPMYSKAWYEQQGNEIWEREREALEQQQQKGDWPSEFDGW